MDTIATPLELQVIDYLEEKEIDYEFKTNLTGGFYDLSDIVVDFLLPKNWMAWRLRTQEAEGVAEIQRQMLEAEGLTVIDLFESDLISRFDETLELALQGTETGR